MWVKICANTSLADAKLAADLGADAVGFVFAPSARRVTVEQVAVITAGLPQSLERIGVFTEGAPAQIACAAREAGLTGVQLHGSFAVSAVNAIRRETGERVHIIRTLHWASGLAGKEDARRAAWLHESGERDPEQRVLLDSCVRGASGGTGVSFAWDQAAAMLKPVRAGQRLIVAGGLRWENVQAAIRALEPWGVDVASGVELSPGKKDPIRLRLFLEHARAV